MKKVVSLFLSVSLILLVACHDEQADIYSDHMNISGEENGETVESEIRDMGEGLSGTLEISSLETGNDVSGWWPLAQGFMELHPNVKIITNDNMIDYLDITSNEEMSIAIEAYSKDLKVRMTSGNAPDLIFEASYEVDNLSSSNLIMDLNYFLDNDPDYVREDYFENVIEAYEVEGKLYLYPLTFYYGLLRFRGDVMDELEIDLDAIKGVDYKFLLDTLQKIEDSGKFPEIKYLGREGREGKNFFRANEDAICFDNETKTINYDTPEFIEFLNATNEYVPGEETIGHFYLDGPEEMFETDSHFAEGLDTYRLNVPRVTSLEKNITKAMPVLSSNGALMINAATVAIPQNAKNPELAWEFIKYCIEESEVISEDFELIGKENGDRFFGQMPINKNNFEKYFGNIFTGLSEESKNAYFDDVHKALENEIVAYLLNEELSVSHSFILKDFYSGLISAEDAVKAMQERAEIYMGENS